MKVIAVRLQIKSALTQLNGRYAASVSNIQLTLFIAVRGEFPVYKNCISQTNAAVYQCFAEFIVNYSTKLPLN